VPGYGRSRALAVAHSKANQSRAIISLLSGLLSGSADPPEQPLILAGHDRGARICHHLSVHNDAREKLPILGTVLLDIVPTLVQFQTFSSPAASMVSEKHLSYNKITFFKPCDHTGRFAVMSTTYSTYIPQLTVPQGLLPLAVPRHSAHSRAHDTRLWRR
jgi:pimeloyl-ACP methyl ester carboxylesterase